MKVSREDEWKVRTHGKSKRRTWRKIHIGADPASGEIQAVALMVEPLLDQFDQPIDRFGGDGSYDKRKVYSSLHQRAPRADILIPPRKNAHIWQHGNSKAEHLKRDENLRAICKTRRAAWKQTSEYHMRSLAETTVFRYKTIFVSLLFTYRNKIRVRQ